MEVETMSMTGDDVLPIVMWTVSTTVVFVNVIVLILGVVRKREVPVDAFLIHNLLFCYMLLCLHPYVVLAMNLLLDHTKATEINLTALCSFASFVGVLISTMCMWTMVTLAGSFLLRLLLPRRFKNLKAYLNALRIVVIAEWVLLGLVAVVPLIPFPQFKEAQRNSLDMLCLPLHMRMLPMWIYTLVIASLDGLSIILLLMLIVVTACQLHRQQRTMVGVTPMEARVIQKNASLVKRVGLMMLSTVAFRFPGVVVVFGADLGVEIPDVVFQWVFGSVIPFSGIIGPVIYMFYAGVEDTTIEGCLHSCRKKAVKGGSTLRLGLGQLTGNVTVPKSINHNKVPEADTTLSNGGVGQHSHDTLPRGSNRAPSEVSWVEDFFMVGRSETFGIVEWQTSNGSPRRGVLQTFHPDSYQQWKTEALVLSRLQSKKYHPNIVECLWHSNSSKTRMDRGSGKESRPLVLERYICTTYHQHGSLKQFMPNSLDKFTESKMHSLACQIAQGLAFLHDNNIVHARLESTNIMVGGNLENGLKVVIANFTNAMDYTKPPRREPQVNGPGTGKTAVKNEDVNPSVPGAVSPDQVEDGTEERRKKPEFSNDIRSFAVLLLEMMAWLKQKAIDTGMDDGSSVRYRSHAHWDRHGPDAAEVSAKLGALVGEGNVRLGKVVPNVYYSPNGSTDALDAETGQLLDGNKDGGMDNRSSPSYKRVYYANQAYALDEMRPRRAMSDAGVYRKILSKRMERVNMPQRPKSGMNEAPVQENIDMQTIRVLDDKKREQEHVGCQTTKQSPPKLMTEEEGSRSGYHSNQVVEDTGVVSDCNRNNVMNDGYNLKDNPRLASTFPRRSMMSSEALKSEKRHSLCSSDSGISSPRNSVRSSNSNKSGHNKKHDMHIIDLTNRVEHSLSDNESSRVSAVSKLKGMLDATAQSLKVGEGSTDEGDSCQEEESMVEYVSNHMEGRKIKQKRLHSCPSDTGSESSKSDVEKITAESHGKSGDHSCDSDKQEETDYDSDRRRGSGDGAETRSASSLSKFYVRKKSATPFTVGIPESLTPPCSRPVSRASSAASLLDSPEGVRPKSCADVKHSYRKYSLGAIKHEGHMYPISNTYAYSHGTLPKDHPSRARRSTMDSRSMTLSRTSNLHENQIVMGRNAWGYSHFVAVHGGGGVPRPLPQAMHNGEHFFISTVPSGVTKRHVAYSQQLLSSLPCLRVAVGQDHLFSLGNAHMAVMEWITIVRDAESCLNKQLLNILKTCWSREPCPEAYDVQCMLDNCVTEVPL